VDNVRDKDGFLVKCEHGVYDPDNKGKKAKYCTICTPFPIIESKKVGS